MAAADISKQCDLTAERLREVLAYDAETGVFTWRDNRGSRAPAGSVAGNVSHQRGYRQIRVDYNRYLAHRLAWLYVYGEWPAAQIDHINGQTEDNRIVNLRPATQRQNCLNSATRSHNEFGHRNIRKKGGKFEVMFSSGKKRVFHKSCSTLEDAIALRDVMARRLHGEFACSR